MRAFANLLDRLAFTPQRNGKLTLLRDFFREAPDPERGWALAALVGTLSFDTAKPALIRKAVEARVDGALFALSYDYVGDLAETVALVWPATPGANREPELTEVVDALRTASKSRRSRKYGTARTRPSRICLHGLRSAATSRVPMRPDDFVP